jgi:hypothetical protein
VLKINDLIEWGVDEMQSFYTGFVALALASFAAFAAQAAGIRVGEYAAHGGGSRLTIAKTLSGQTFAVDTSGADGHRCRLRGEIRDGRAVLKGSDAKAPCIVILKAAADGVDVNTADDAVCRREFCGAHATFAGVYRRAPAICTQAQARRTQDKFAAQIKQKQFREALTTLGPLIKQCGGFVEGRRFAALQNEFALTAHRAGDNASCRTALTPLRARAAKTDAELTEEFAHAPTEAAQEIRIAKTTRAHARRCDR